MAKEEEGGSAEESESGREGNSRKKEPNPTKHGGDEANKGEKALTETWFDVVKGLKTKDELETTHSDESRNRSEAADLVRMFDSETPNQLKAKRKKGKQKRRQYRDNNEDGKGRISRQADRKGRGARNRTSRGARAKREARRNRSDDLEEREEPQVELEGEC